MESTEHVLNSPAKSFKGIEKALKPDLSNYSNVISTIINVVVVLLLIIFGFALKEEELLTAENGLGYALGIIGGSMMLLLVIYPIRKRMKTARYMGSVRLWFRIHMIFGVAGPLAILYHSNFSTGSMNSTVALFCMIIVASSGVVGRYFYSKIHYGLYGKKADMSGLIKSIEKEEGKLLVIYNIAPELKDQLKQFQNALHVSLTLGDSVKRFFVLGTKVRLAGLILPFKLNRKITGHARKYQWTPLHTKRFKKLVKMHIRYYLQATLRVCEFSIYERLFALWHTFHLPLFIMMIVTGIIHVVAVHMY
ncbi:MAG TPA: transcriptional regulator [Gammaproteobacteria bacterium]